jgi:hypothetical protein
MRGNPTDTRGAGRCADAHTARAAEAPPDAPSRQACADGPPRMVCTLIAVEIQLDSPFE